MTPLFKKFLGINWILMFTLAGLLTFGIYAIFNASSFRIDSPLGLDSKWRDQITWIGLGVPFLLVAALIDYKWIRWACVPMYLAGIPGLVLAIAAGLEAHLYESNGKKAAFLREAARQTRTKAHVHAVRLETLRNEPDLPKVDCVVARALAPLPLLLDYAEPFLAQGAIGLFHKGQDVDAELTEATKYWKIRMTKHASQCDSRGVILEIHEATRV